MDSKQFNVFSEVKFYLRLSRELQTYLSKNPYDWEKFQDTFNTTLNKLYDDLLQFERDSIDRFEDKVYQLRRIFEKRYRRHFLYGDFIRWSYEKPFGYAGDFKIIDDIYLNDPRTIGFDRLWDNYFHQLAITCAVRERKEDLKNILADACREKAGRELRVMNLASGPAREIKEFLQMPESTAPSHIIFDCYELDNRAIDYAKRLLDNHAGVRFFQKNAVRLALKKDIHQEIPYSYDLIYSAGLFDYLDERVAVRLVAKLKDLLKPGGTLLIANMADKFSNSSACWMEWVVDWNLIYRTEDEFRKIFLDAGFSKGSVTMQTQGSKVVQYCFARP